MINCCTYPTKKGLLQHSSLLLIRLLMLHIPHKEGASTTQKDSVNIRWAVALTPQRRGFYNAAPRRIKKDLCCTYPTKKGLLQQVIAEFVHNQWLHIPHKEGASTTGFQNRWTSDKVAPTPQRRGFYNCVSSRGRTIHCCTYPTKKGLLQLENQYCKNPNRCTYPTKKGLLQLLITSSEKQL